ncbi:hypothetical protein H8356DRAFT_1345713 [Neocallimastix lanati (nom. inval.)]|nr:hypothetical protein H8356DRAFT_1345713 [Neocallimastix sp. JGI-2020a]
MYFLFKFISFLLVLICITFSFLNCEVNYQTCTELRVVIAGGFLDKFVIKSGLELTSHHRELFEAGVFEACCFKTCQDYINVIKHMRKYDILLDLENMICKHYG